MGGIAAQGVEGVGIDGVGAEGADADGGAGVADRAGGAMGLAVGGVEHGDAVDRGAGPGDLGGDGVDALEGKGLLGDGGAEADCGLGEPVGAGIVARGGGAVGALAVPGGDPGGDEVGHGVRCGGR